MLYESVKSLKGQVQIGRVPECCKNSPCCLGIDEAGRGPVLGPMVYGICYSPLLSMEAFKKFGFDDSKALTDEKRREFFEMIKASDLMGWMVHVLLPEYLSNCMLGYLKYNLNEVSHDTAMELIQKALDSGVQVEQVFVDTVGDPGKYQAKLKEKFPQLEITVSKKADSLFPVVSAASICAKVIRDNVVNQWVFQEGALLVPEGGYGSGYPGDPLTKEFLQSNIDVVFGFPNFVRFSWSTAQKILMEKAAAVSWPDDEDDDNALKQKGIVSISKFFQQKKCKRRAPFFEHRCLKIATQL